MSLERYTLDMLGHLTNYIFLYPKEEKNQNERSLRDVRLKTRIALVDKSQKRFGCLGFPFAERRRDTDSLNDRLIYVMYGHFQLR